ncbi:hypothetical protein [Actinoalloteichus spitiensis]|uniref:hypothetical protein n=1 Tax=Actinoalloteichus spitiensis TaxID=252394 RepID=UPI0003782F0E|nr:hypothetical protein [Actinoalloteichus spitiensis]
MNGTTSGGLPKRAPRRASSTEQGPRAATERPSSAQAAKALHDALDGFELGQDAARKETAATAHAAPPTEPATGRDGTSAPAGPESTAGSDASSTTKAEAERPDPARRQPRGRRAAGATRSAATAGEADPQNSDSPADVVQETAHAGGREPVNPTTKERDGLT